MTTYQELQERVQQAQELAAAVPDGIISREDHGPAGQQAIYIGRGPRAHGLNIVHVTEPAYQWPAVFNLFAASQEHIMLITELWELLEKQRELLDFCVHDLSFCPACAVDYMSQEFTSKAPVHAPDCRLAESLNLPREKA